jgi:predicted GIY-YIG superfamily endonuclease
VTVGKPNSWGEEGLAVLRAASADAPRTPGVYFFLADSNEILYVGKATNLRQRLRQHAAGGIPQSQLHQRYDLVRRVVWEPADNEEAAVWREAELIFALRPPFNANTGLRATDPIGKDAPAPYIVVQETKGLLSFTLEPTVPATGRAYGCFPHLGKGVASRLGIACSDGYTALLRLLWAASGEGTHTPAAITKSAPPSFTVAGPEGDTLHRFLSGTSPKLADQLLLAATDRPSFMQPALRRDRDAVLRFFAAGPRLVRAHRLHHHLTTRLLDVETYRQLLRDEITPLIALPTT